MAEIVRLFKNRNRPYGLLAVDANGDVIWAHTTDDKPTTAAMNRVPVDEFNRMLEEEGWEPDVNTSFTFVDGKFRDISADRTTL